MYPFFTQKKKITIADVVQEKVNSNKLISAKTLIE